MTDERVPGTGTAETDRDRDPRGPDAVDDEPTRRQEPDGEGTSDEGSPLLREGPDAPDAADIEDPDEQL